MSETEFEIRKGAYYDSVVLMRLQRDLAGLPDVIDAGVVMATAANRDLLSVNDLLPDSMSASPDDLLIVVKADTKKSASNALGNVDELLARRKSSALSEDFRPHSLSAAVKQLPDANFVLVSVPGRYAAGVAREALDFGKHVFLYSDNVSLEDEIALKKIAREKGLLVMGPDCGTAIINGIGLGFANRVRSGQIGLVGASGTGTQAVTSHVHALGGGISHAIGTGGRDLNADVNAITAHQALDLLKIDPGTKVIVLVSKPPSSEVATKLISAAQDANKPVVVYFIGYPAPARKIGYIHFAISLSEAAEIAVGLINRNLNLAGGDTLPNPKSYLRGLFSGGTLAYETLLGLQASLSPIYSNAPIYAHQTLKDPLKSESHTIIDLGDEYFMVGRLHPMIDNDLRIRRLKQEAADPEVGMILLDVVLGDGSHPDPTSELAPVINDILKERTDLTILALVIGTDEDPQDIQLQIDRLEKANLIVFRSVTEVVEYISLIFSKHKSSQFPPIALDSLTQEFTAINIGLETFYESLKLQGAQAIHVEWRPPAGGDEKLASLLARMKN